MAKQSCRAGLQSQEEFGTIPVVFLLFLRKMGCCYDLLGLLILGNSTE